MGNAVTYKPIAYGAADAMSFDQTDNFRPPICNYAPQGTIQKFEAGELPNGLIKLGKSPPVLGWLPMGPQQSPHRLSGMLYKNEPLRILVGCAGMINPQYCLAAGPFAISTSRPPLQVLSAIRICVHSIWNHGFRFVLRLKRASACWFSAREVVWKSASTPETASLYRCSDAPASGSRPHARILGHSIAANNPAP